MTVALRRDLEAPPARLAKHGLCKGGFVGRSATGALYVVAMAGVVVAVDILFFRGHFWERLAVNVGIVLVFAAFYFRFLRRA